MKKHYLKPNRLHRVSILSLLFLTLFCFNMEDLEAQRRNRNQNTTVSSSGFDEKVYDAIEWRSIGPYRGGRSCAVTGVAGKPQLFYFGSTGGGVWRTQDGGSTWSNISDGYFGGSIGSIAVSEWDNNVIYVGGGEKTVRGNVSYGYGVWKSTDAGKTWQQMGLKDSRHISRIRIHPKNPDWVYAAVMGNLFSPHQERGVFRSKDGGQTWEKVLFANDLAGAVDLAMDPSNPRVLYASTWRIQRTPYSLESGGEGSALWKSTDGGDNWTNISENKGLPKGTWGINAVTVSPQNSERVWSIIENENGGVFRSDDGGETWKKTNDKRALRQRAWYYTRIYADSQDEDIVYVVNVNYHKSTDGGNNFKSGRAPHGDHHDLWIAPEDNQRMIIGDDGGAQVSYDSGDNWSTYHNQPTSQFYRVTTDNHFPYRIYGAQQDNSTVRISHRTDGWTIDEEDWDRTAGGESAHIAIDPTNNDIVYGGSYGGFLTRYDHQSGAVRAINVWPDNPMGYGAEGMKYRFQWNFPVFFSPHNTKKLYAASNHLHVSTDEGQSWEIISPDLTRNVAEKMVSSGGPITKDNTGVEYYCTVFAAVESYHEEGVIWAGSDDGLLHITRDGGKKWDKVTPTGMPEWMMINSIDIDPFEKGGAYVAGTRYKMGDFQPYLYRTKDYGKTWTKITNGIDRGHFTRALRADPKRKGLLYAGTESGMYVSFNDGGSWQPFQLNLPIVPITDLAIKDNNLIAATQGRSFWLIDDLTPLHQLDNSVKNKTFHLFQPKPSYRMDGGSTKEQPSRAGKNHPAGVMVYYNLKDAPDKDTEVKLEFLQDTTVIKSYSTKAKKPNEKLEVEAGSNLFTWDMSYPDAKRFDGMIMWWASLSGPQAVPGTYKVRMTVGEDSQEQDFEVVKDPRSESSQADLQAQFDFLMDINEKMTETHEAIINIRDVRSQLNTYSTRVKGKEGMDTLVNMASAIDSSMTVIEEKLYQTKNRSRQDPLNFPIQMNNKLGHLTSLTSIGDYRPTDQAVAFKNEITTRIDEQLTALKAIFDKQLPAFNALVKSLEVDAVMLKEE